MNLLSTKFFFPPARQNRVSRPRLLEKVIRGLQGQLLLISAPAGYGKTTIMSEWRASVGHDNLAVWLSLDKDDNDFKLFMTSLIMGLESLINGFGEKTKALLQSSPPITDRVILTSLVNELGIIENPISLILEDYHVITERSVHEVVTYLLQHLPSHIHLVILTRVDPPLPLSRMRARNQLVEIRVADLCFTIEEASVFLNKTMELHLSIEQISALEERTEGWVAALQLAALSMQGRTDVEHFISGFTGSHHFIVDFLADEVFNNQPEPIHEFLLRTSILEQMSAPLCDVLTGRHDSKAILEGLEHANMFIIPLDDEQNWYRYHHLFLEVLRKRLTQIYPDEILELHHKAMNWCEQNGMIVQAVEHALVIKDYDHVVHLFSQYYYQTLTVKYPAQVRRWFNSIPDTVIRNDPWMCVVNAWRLWGQGERDGAEDYLIFGQQALNRWLSADLMPKGNREYEALPSEIPVFQGFINISKGNYDNAYELTQQALTQAPEAEYTVRGIAHLNLYHVHRERGETDKAVEACRQAITMTKAGGVQGPIIDALHNLSLMYMVQGHLRRAVHAYQDNIKFAQKEWPQNTPHSSIFHIHLAEIYYEWNDLDEAEHLANQALEMSDLLFRWVSIYARIFLARVGKARRNFSKAHQKIEEAGTLVRQTKGHLYEEQLEFYLARVKAELGKKDEVERWSHDISFSNSGYSGYTKLYMMIQLAYTLESLGRDDELLALLSSSKPAIETQGYLYWMAQSLVLEAVVWQKKKTHNQALSCLEKALSLAEKEGYVRLFLDRGEPMFSLLQIAFKKGVHPEYVTKLISTMVSEDKGSKLPQYLIEPLSERELEILRFVAGGASNSEIAKALYIANGTVKKHINNIFGKLGVQRRTECVARARELKLL